jgi:hypothetical protein
MPQLTDAIGTLRKLLIATPLRLAGGVELELLSTFAAAG